MPGRNDANAGPAARERLVGSDLSMDANFLLARTNALSLAASNAALAEHGLKVRSYAVLTVAASGDRPSQRELAAFLQLDPSQVVALVDDLEERGLVERLPDPTDRRANVVVATEAGLAKVEAARRVVQDVDSRTYASLSDSEREQLTALLKRLAFPEG